jgi:hypothetical protein
VVDNILLDHVIAPKFRIPARAALWQDAIGSWS